MQTKKLVAAQTPVLSGDCDVSCPVQRTAKILDGKWTTLIVRDLIGGKKRYSELQRSLVGISPRLLAARLRLLEQHGMLTRTVYPTVPPTTEYELTTLGKGLRDVIKAMAKFGGNWV
ncbi:MAG: helix-turn-helix domain-containing protein [Gallionella sp.]|nr:helix-turn-helix transcriptional regulator [Gallionella sp.]